MRILHISLGLNFHVSHVTGESSILSTSKTLSPHMLLLLPAVARQTVSV